MTQLIRKNKENHLIETIEKIELEFPLSYSDTINALFTQLQKQLETFSSLPKTLISRLQTIWGYRGYSMEKHFSMQKEYKKFDFYPKYRRLLEFDTRCLRKSMKNRRYSKVIFIGSGPLPLSLKLLRLNIQKVGYDVSNEALDLAKVSVPKDRFGRKIIYKKGNFFNLTIKEKQPVVIYVAGLIQGKENGLKRLAKQLPKGSLMVVRTVANDKRGFLYEKINKNALYRIGQAKEFIPTKSSGVVNGMIIIKI